MLYNSCPIKSDSSQCWCLFSFTSNFWLKVFGYYIMRLWIPFNLLLKQAVPVSGYKVRAGCMCTFPLGKVGYWLILPCCKWVEWKFSYPLGSNDTIPVKVGYWSTGLLASVIFEWKYNVSSLVSPADTRKEGEKQLTTSSTFYHLVKPHYCC